jgi:putative heme-binding domain-containing protein
MTDIRRLALDKKATIETRRTALRTLINSRPRDLRKVCESLLRDRAVNGVAVTGLALFDDARIGTKLVQNYNRFQAVDRPTVLSTLVSRPSFAGALLDNIGNKKGQLPSTTISAFHARQIRSLGDDGLNKKLAEVWGEIRDSPADRRALIETYRTKLQPATIGDANLSNGRLLFRKTCSQCHQLYQDGQQIGPNLTGAQRSNLDYLLENILDPSAVVGKDYRMTIVVTEDGRSLNGLVVSKDDKKLVLRTDTELKTIPIDDIDEMKQTSLSPMPDGLLQKLSASDVRDLFAYLMHPVQVELP